MSEKMDVPGGNMTGFLMGTLVGAITGAGVSLLLAPRSGKGTRNWLKTTYREARDRSVKAVQQEKKAILKDIKDLGGDHEESPSYIGSGSSTARL